MNDWSKSYFMNGKCHDVIKTHDTYLDIEHDCVFMFSVLFFVKEN